MPQIEENITTNTTNAVEKNTTTNTTSEDPNKLPPELRKGIIREYFESALVTVIMALFGMTFIVQAVKVPTGSMLNTILVGDHLLVNKFIFGKDGLKMDYFLPHRQIKRGDVIVFKYPGDPSTNYVKRVIGLPGETIQVKGTKVFINGQELPEQEIQAEQTQDNNAPLIVNDPGNTPKGSSYKVYYTTESDEPYDPAEKKMIGQKYAIDEPFLIPSDQYFAMGDNRDNSQDSRYWGTVPRDNIVGRALVVYWSLDLTKDPNTDAPPSGGLLNDFFTKTRWNRMGTVIK